MFKKYYFNEENVSKKQFLNTLREKANITNKKELNDYIKDLILFMDTNNNKIEIGKNIWRVK